MKAALQYAKIWIFEEAPSVVPTEREQRVKKSRGAWCAQWLPRLVSPGDSLGVA